MLIYIGNGAFLPDVPARDLSADEAKHIGINYLLQSGLYKLAEQPKKTKQSETAQPAEGE